MIDIDVKRQNQHIVFCHIEGHAEYDNHGYDIVCAAISAISCTAILGLQEVVKDDGVFENAPGYCHIEPKHWDNGECQAILKTMVLGFQEISRQYNEFVKVTII